MIYLHQRPTLLEGSVEENLRYPFGLLAHRGKALDRQFVLEHLDRMGRAPSFLSKASRELSGGESQIVALLRAIQLDASVLLLDEPTASLDQAAARSVETLIDCWYQAGKGGRSFIWVSHDPAQTGRMAERHLVMRSGRLSSGG